MELYEGDAGCVLPCVWGIVPGQTTWAEARDWLAPLDEPAGPYGTPLVSRYDFEITSPPDLEGQVYFGFALGVKDGGVVGITLNSSGIRRDFDYSLAGWLQALGVPEEIWLSVLFDPAGLPQYELDLFYPSMGIMVNGDGYAEARGDEFVICPVPFRNGNFPNVAKLWSPELEVTYANVMEQALGYKPVPTIREYRRLEDWTDQFGPDEFHATYSVAGTSACFEVHPPVEP
jgi:hypothetical protein